MGKDHLGFRNDRGKMTLGGGGTKVFFEGAQLILSPERIAFVWAGARDILGRHACEKEVRPAA